VKIMIVKSKKKNKNFFEDSNFESCVVCRCITDIPISTPVNERAFFISGIGQLCQKCWEKLQQESQ